MIKLCKCGCKGHIPKNSRREYIKGHIVSAWKWPIKKKCNKCKKTLPIKNFYNRTIVSRYNIKYKRPMSYCKNCSRKISNSDRDRINKLRKEKRKQIRINGNFPAYIAEKIYSYSKRAKNNNIPFDLTKDGLMNIFNIQEGRCYYTGVKLILSDIHCHPNNISLDRKNPDKGYIMDNVVWCSYLTNNMKRDLSIDKFYNVIKLIYSKHIA